jgi:septal ring factor EnvC (AmiA/AmiB activator)
MPLLSQLPAAATRRRPSGARRAALAATVLTAVLGTIAAPTPAGAAPSRPPTIKELQAQRAKVRADAARTAAHVDVLKATDDELTKALAALQHDVATQAALLQDAETARLQAEADVAAADAALEQSQKELAALESNIRNEAIDAYVNAPRDDEWTVFAGGDPNDALTRRTFLKMRSTRSQDSAEQYRAIQEDLAIQRQARSDAAAKAAQKKSAAEQQLASLQASQEQQESVQAEVDARIDRALAEAASLQQLDGALSAEISDRQAKLAAQIEAARKAAAARRS